MGKIFQRFVDIWKMDFLAKLVAKEQGNVRTTVYFWIVSNVFVAFLLVCSFCFYAIGFQAQIEESIEKNVPEGAQITVSKGQLITKNIDEPFFREITVENEYDSEYVENYVIIFDTHAQGYDITSLDEYTGGIIALHDRVYMKNNDRIDQILFSEVSDFSISRSQVLSFIDVNYAWILSLVLLIVFVFSILNYAVFRLIFSLWWALMLWIISRIFEIPLSYGVSYKATLNFYFIPTIIIVVLGRFGVYIPFLLTAIFIMTFVVNLLWMKRNKIDVGACEIEKNMNVKNVPEVQKKVAERQ